MTNWIRVEDQTPPGHKKLLFLDFNEKIWQGDMCYGMHAPWFCVHSPDGRQTVVLNDEGVKVTHWMLYDDAVQILGPKNSS